MFTPSYVRRFRRLWGMTLRMGLPVSAFAISMGITTESAYTTASQLRANGVNLPKFKRGRRSNAQKGNQ